jgi:inositol phosphorylceramide mannosyltransferase catalytic subunit
MIPRIFHQVWVGPEPLPPKYRRYQETWVQHHPGWELRVWTDENLPPDLERKEVYERLRQPAERSDMLIFEFLNRYGGVYIDTDFECLRSIEPLLDGVEIFCAYSHFDSHSERLNNAIMGSAPGHRLIAQGLRELRPRDTYGPVDKAGTGPFFVTELFVGRPEVTLFGPELFYPRTPGAAKSAYGIHHTGRSWKSPRALWKDAKSAEKRLAVAQDELALLRHEHTLALAELDALRRGRGLHALILRIGRAVPRLAVARVRRRLRRTKPPVQ